MIARRTILSVVVLGIVIAGFGPVPTARAQTAPVVEDGAASEEGEVQQPVFRTGVELIELDVSVLDANRRPVRGLTADDFTVLEDGQPQPVVAVSHVDLADYDPSRSARMRYVTRDVAANDLSDQPGDGRLVAIVFDDVNVPAADPDRPEE